MANLVLALGWNLGHRAAVLPQWHKHRVITKTKLPRWGKGDVPLTNPLRLQKMTAVFGRHRINEVELARARGVGRGSLLWTTGTTARHHPRGSLFDADMGSRFDAYLQRSR